MLKSFLYFAMKHKFWGLLILVSLLLSGCQSFGLDYFGLSGEVLFSDDFSQPNSGWRRASDDHGSADYFDTQSTPIDGLFDSVPDQIFVVHNNHLIHGANPFSFILP